MPVVLLVCTLTYVCTRVRVHLLQDATLTIVFLLLWAWFDAALSACYHMFRLLLLYHEPELCLFLDSSHVAPHSFLTEWVRPLVSVYVCACMKRCLLLHHVNRLKLIQPCAHHANHCHGRPHVPPTQYHHHWRSFGASSRAPAAAPFPCSCGTSTSPTPTPFLVRTRCTQTHTHTPQAHTERGMKTVTLKSQGVYSTRAHCLAHPLTRSSPNTHPVFDRCSVFPRARVCGEPQGRPHGSWRRRHRHRRIHPRAPAGQGPMGGGRQGGALVWALRGRWCLCVAFKGM